MKSFKNFLMENFSKEQNPVETELKSYAEDLSGLAQGEYEAWQQDEEGMCDELGQGGICDAISSKFGEYLSDKGFDIMDGGHEGDDHAYIYATKDGNSFMVDIHPSHYETGGGMKWRKKPNVVLNKDHVDIIGVKFDDIYGKPYTPQKD